MTELKNTMILRLNHPYRIKWDLIVMALSIWNSISTPIEISFEKTIFEEEGIHIFNSVVDAIFIIDILINFRTSYINPLNGDEVIKPSKITNHYLKEMFTIDLISALPFESMFASFFDDTKGHSNKTL